MEVFKMKLFKVLLIIGLACATPIDNSKDSNATALKNDIQDFLEIIPIEKIKKIAIQHLHDDVEFQAAVKYMKGPEWKALMTEFQEKPATQKLVTFLKDAGFDLMDLQQYACSFLKDVKVETDHQERSFKKFMEDVRKVIPLAAIIEMFDNKIRNSPAFAEFYAKISGNECHELVQEVRALPVYKKIANELLTMGVDLEAMLRVLHGVFNWEMKSLENL